MTNTVELSPENYCTDTQELRELISSALSEEHGQIAIIHVSTGKKNLTVNGVGSGDGNTPLIGISSSLDEDYIGDLTFPDRKNWTIICADSSKYSITVVLRKPMCSS